MKAGLCFLLPCAMSFSFQTATAALSLGAGLSLSHLSSFQGPPQFAEAVQIDSRLRGGLALDKTPYLHMLRMPLAEAVALDETALGTDGERDGFGNECEGHCGV